MPQPLTEVAANDVLACRPTMWHPQGKGGVLVTRVQLDEPLYSKGGYGRARLAANSHVDLRSDGRGEVEARVSVNSPSVATMRLHLCGADGGRLRTVEVPQLAVRDLARWKEWRAAFSFPAAEYNDVASVDIDFDDVPAA
jgi:hypothetical protein